MYDAWILNTTHAVSCFVTNVACHVTGNQGRKHGQRLAVYVATAGHACFVIPLCEQ